MRLALTGRNLTITPALRQAVTRRLEKLDRHLHDSITTAQVALQVQKDQVKADVRVRTTGDHDLSGHGLAKTAQASALAAIAKIEAQASKVKGKWEERKRGASVKAAAAAPVVVVEVAPKTKPRVAKAVATAEPRVVRVRRSSAKPMRLEDALLRVDAPAGSVFVFRDAELDRVQVLVRRADGHVGLVDPDA
jgi:putative sigma-54 modulation protein